MTPSLCFASVLSSLWGLHLNFSLYSKATGSQVPYKSLHPSHATSMPVVAWPVRGFPPGCSLRRSSPQVLTTSIRFSTPHQWFTFVHLLDAYLIPSCGTFSLTLTTMTLNHSSLRWFEIYALTSIPRGLPSSLVQHELPLQFFLAHWSGSVTHVPLKAVVGRPLVAKNFLYKTVSLAQGYGQPA